MSLYDYTFLDNSTMLIKKYVDYLTLPDSKEKISLLDNSQYGLYGEKAILEKSQRLAEYIEKETDVFLAKYWDKIDNIAKLLIKNELVSSKEVEELINVERNKKHG